MGADRHVRHVEVHSYPKLPYFNIACFAREHQLIFLLLIGTNIVSGFILELLHAVFDPVVILKWDSQASHFPS